MPSVDLAPTLINGTIEAGAKIDYLSYFLMTNPKSRPFAHTKYICDKMQKIVDGEQHFYICELPPQHGKSMTITETLPSYYLMRNPDKKVLVAAYGEGLFSQFADRNREKFAKYCGLFDLRVGKNTAEKFTVAGHDGEAFFTSITGSATGHSADLLIIDDPIKNDEEASSPTIKDRVWKEWTKTFSTRLQDNSSVVIIMTRWEQDDLAGRLLKRMSRPWEEIKLPAIAHDIPDGQTDAIGRHNGDALCPELHSKKDLLIQKRDMGTRAFTALYQQSPTIEGGNIFKRDWVHYYVPDRQTMIRLGLTDKDVVILPKHLDDTVQAWDATFKSKENDDFVAGQTWSRRGAHFFLRPGWFHKRADFVQTMQAIRDQKKMYPRTSAILVEDKANGPAIIDTLQTDIPGIMPVSPGADSKEARAASVSPLWEAGQVFVPHPLWHPEIEDWLEEIINFPNAPHDDNVDSHVYALRRLNGRAKGPVFRI